MNDLKETRRGLKDLSQEFVSRSIKQCNSMASKSHSSVSGKINNLIFLPPLRVLKFIFQKLKFFSDILHAYSVFKSIYAKLQRFI